MFDPMQLVNFIQNNINDTEINYGYPPSYINRLVQRNHKIIFAYKIKPSGTLPNNDTIIEFNDQHRSIDFDLSGSPLKDDECGIDLIDTSFDLGIHEKLWSIVENNYGAISCVDARSLLNKVNFFKPNVIVEKSSSQNISVWILCDDEKSPLLHTTFKEGWNSRGIVKILDPIPYESILSLQILNTHVSYIPRAHTINADIETVFNIEPNVQLTVHQTKTINVPIKMKTIELFKFTNDCEVILVQKINLKDLNKSTQSLWDELMLLNNIKRNIEKFDNHNDTSIDETIFKIDMDEGDLKKRLMDILSGALVDEKMQKHVESSLKSDDLEKNILNVQQTQCILVTDKLWNLLKFYSSSDCNIALTLLFQLVAQCNMDIPTTSNRLSELLNEISKQRIAIPHLIGSEPLKLLLEIGIDKLFRVYETILIASKICTENELKVHFSDESLVESSKHVPESKSRLTLRKTIFNRNVINIKDDVKCGFQNTKYDEQEVNNKLSKLGQIHTIIEHLILAQRNFKLKNLNIAIFKETIQNSSPKSLNQLAIENVDVLKIKVEDHKRIQLIENPEPFLKRIELVSHAKDSQISNVFYFSREPIFPFQEKEIEDYLGKMDQPLYFHTHYMKIDTKK